MSVTVPAVLNASSKTDKWYTGVVPSYVQHVPVSITGPPPNGVAWAVVSKARWENGEAGGVEGEVTEAGRRSATADGVVDGVGGVITDVVTAGRQLPSAINILRAGLRSVSVSVH